MKRNLGFIYTDWKQGYDIGLMIIRVVLALVLFYGHGFEKISVILSGQQIHFMDPIGIGANTSFYMAGFAEGICSILLIFGLFSRFASLILAIDFIVIFIFHAFISGDGFQVLELRFLYLFTFIALIFTGPGRFSLDYLLFRKKNNFQK
ncbi:MAG: DoxX family protein [Bacteroidetes bacterium]|nr:DoxX family protein [Bacteroidota bacterium]